MNAVPDIDRFASAASCPIIILSVSVGCAATTSTDTTFGTVDSMIETSFETVTRMMERLNQ
jgi:hypothetical protein